MERFLVFCLALAAVSAASTVEDFTDYEEGLKVKWSTPFDSESFYKIPRYEKDIITLGYKQYTRAETLPLQSLKLYCKQDDVTFCAMYDDSGYMAGLQIALSKTTFTNNPFSLDVVAFTTWTVDGEEYWTQQQYFVSEEFLAKTADEREEIRKADGYETLAESKLWLPSLEGGLLEVAVAEDKVGETLFKKEACIPSMGLHYYYNMSSAIDCEALYPWFTLYNDEALVATGFMVFGTYPVVADDKRMWFETPSKTAVKVIVPDAPECLYDLSETPGVLTMHIYYTKKRAYSILCPLLG